MRTFVLAAMAAFFPASGMAQGISLTIEGLRNDRGHVLIAVFDQARAFNRLRFDKAVDFAQVPARRGEVLHRFPDLTAGPYAIVLFHDENDDGDLNHQGNRLLEGLGASGAPNPEDDPGFAQAAVPPGPVRVHIHYDQ